MEYGEYGVKSTMARAHVPMDNLWKEDAHV
jgi:hypothetical protein